MTFLETLGAAIAIPFGLVLAGYCFGYGFQAGTTACQQASLERLRRKQLDTRDQEIRDLERLAGQED